MGKSETGFKILLLNFMPLGFLSLLSHSCAKFYLYLHLLKFGTGNSRDQRLEFPTSLWSPGWVRTPNSWWLLAGGGGELTHSVAVL